ncbi:MAG TPA: hypothetical protein VGK96_11825 [Candidatus Sulfotelmatobacter sp.]
MSRIAGWTVAAAMPSNANNNLGTLFINLAYPTNPGRGSIPCVWRRTHSSASRNHSLPAPDE